MTEEAIKEAEAELQAQGDVSFTTDKQTNGDSEEKFHQYLILNNNLFSFNISRKIMQNQKVIS